MKKLISLLLCAAMLFGMSAICASAADDIKIIVANDLHLSVNAYKPYKGNTTVNKWAHVPSSGQLICESNAIITAFLENAAKSDADYILLPGDLTDTGLEEEHILLAEKLANFESTTGKQVFVAVGNHDIRSTTVEKFTDIYNKFGYSQALEAFDGAYTADLDNDYRLISINSVNVATGEPLMNDERVEWITQQLAKAKEDGKKVIAMMHHNLLEHFIFAELIHKTATVKAEGFADLLADNGVKFIFTAHTHDQDIAEYKSAEGNVIYDVVTNTLNGYPCQYREVTFANDVTFTAKTVDKIDVSLLPEGLSDEAVALAGESFTQYTKTVMWTGLRKSFTSYLNAAALIKLMNLDAEADAEMCAIITKLGDKISEIAKMPFYTKDSSDGSSMEKLAAKYGKALPASGYTDLIDLVITLYQAHCLGDENFPANSVELQLATNAVATVLSYCLEDVSAEEYTAVLKFALTFANADVPDNLLSFAGDSISRIKGIDLIVSLAFRPLAAEFTTDNSPADNNVTLTGYRELSDFEKFIQAIRDFFKKIIDFFAKLFAFSI